MNRDEFCKHHWDYYLVLEKDFLITERYVSFDLGDNYLYNQTNPTDVKNSLIFSNEYIKQYQAICSEVDAVLKSICKELGNYSAEKMDAYTPTILTQWKDINQQKVKVYEMELQPFANWEVNPYKSPYWWKPYNEVKHDRIKNYTKANLKNVLNALAGLYVLNIYFVKFIGDRDKVEDVPNDISHIFEMIDFKTRNSVISRDVYLASTEEVQAVLNRHFQ